MSAVPARAVPGRLAAATARLRPDRDTLVDAAFVLGLTALALLTLRSTYTGQAYLLTGVAGTLLGLLIAHVGTAWRLPWPLLPVALAAGYLLLGGAVALGGDPHGGWAPVPSTWGELVRLATRGWADLLTTLPPVDGTGPLVVLPFLVGLLAGGIGLTVAARLPQAGAPLPVALAALVGTILLGTADPGSLLVVGIATALGSVWWAGLRARRSIVQTATGRWARAVTGAVLLAVAAGVVALAAPVLPGTGVEHRAVLRARLTPPLDLSAFPSPLVGFRKYRPAAQQLADAPLFTVQGLPDGTPVRIAALDAYDRVVWSVRNDPSGPAVGDALDTFQRVGASVATPAEGRHVRMTVTIADAYAAARDTSGWLPDAGSPTGFDFSGPRADAHAASLRYNLATGTVVVPDRLRAGDRYTVAAVLPDDAVPAEARPGGRPTVDPAAMSFVQPAVVRYTAGVTGDAWTKTLAVADHLRTDGAYSDGGPGETQFLPGHSVGRLTTFLSGQQPVGDDEQYAATFALMANLLGVPARVVLGAVPGPGGVVRGRDVHAWVEVQLAGRGWVTVPTSRFTPPTDRKPKLQQVQQFENADTSVVPPPNAVRPPSSLDQLPESGSNSSRRAQRQAGQGDGWHLPAAVVTALRWGGPPLGALVLVLLLIVAAKAVRRRRRRVRGSPAGRVAAGWREVLDVARDLGIAVSALHTRREQAARLGAPAAHRLAEVADLALFSPAPAGPGTSTDYWADVARMRRDLLLGVGRWERFRARVSLRSFRAMPSGGR